jgi:hypothetical protein
MLAKDQPPTGSPNHYRVAYKISLALPEASVAPNPFGAIKFAPTGFASNPLINDPDPAPYPFGAFAPWGKGPKGVSGGSRRL